MFFKALKEYREPQTKLADYLPWALLVADGVVQQKEGYLQRTIGYRGRDLDSVTSEELTAVSAQISSALARLGGGWGLFFECQRKPAHPYMSASIDNPLGAVVDAVRRENFCRAGALFESHYFLTLVYRPPSRAQNKLLLWLFASEEQQDSCAYDKEQLEHFERKTRELLGLLQGVLPTAYFLDSDQTLTYLHSCVSTKDHPVKTPPVPMYLDAMLVDVPVHLGMELFLGSHYVQALTIKGFPAATHPQLLNALGGCAFPLRWVSRFLTMSKEQAASELARYERRLFQKQDRLGAALSGKESALKNRAALDDSDQVGHALQQLQQDHQSAGLLTVTVVVSDPDPGLALRRIEALERELGSLGFVTVREMAGLPAAWLGSLPGHLWANPRRPILLSDNVADLVPAAASWSGESFNAHLDGPAHVFCVTEGSTPFYLNLNVGDVGHSLILGPTGAGKSTLLGLLQLQWLKYKDSQVIIFDKGRSSRISTLCAGGAFLELCVEHPQTSFAPLACIDELGEANRAQLWLEELFALEHITIDASIKREIWSALGQLAQYPKKQRTLSLLRSLLQHRGLKLALGPYVGSGPYAALFDNSQERLAAGRWLAFEMGSLMEQGDKKLTILVLRYLFRRLEQRFDGRPTLLVLDEAWVFLDDPLFAPKIRQWLKTLRKYNVFVLFASQSVADAMGSSIAPTLIESCPTKILLPNKGALSLATRPYYEQLGLSARQIELLALASPKQHYYYSSPLGERLFELGLSPLELALIGASSPADQALLDEVLSLSQEQEGLAARYLRKRGFSSYASQLRDA